MKTFIDSGVLIIGWRGEQAKKLKALTYMSDLNRVYIASPFVQLEVLPKPNWYKNALEVRFYEHYFDTRVSLWVSDCDFLADEALRIGSRYGLGGMDALHIAAALEAGADEFITSERLTSPLFRVQGITVRTIA